MSAEKNIGALGEFLAALTLTRVFLGLLIGAGGVMIAALWEQRAIWTPLFWQSAWLLSGLCVGLLLIAVGASVNSLQSRLEARTESLYRQMRDQIVDLQTSTGQQILALQTAEQACQNRLQEVLLKMAELGHG